MGVHRERIDALLAELEPGWALTANGHLLRNYEFRNFAEALAFAAIAAAWR